MSFTLTSLERAAREADSAGLTSLEQRQRRAETQRPRGSVAHFPSVDDHHGPSEPLTGGRTRSHLMTRAVKTTPKVEHETSESDFNDPPTESPSKRQRLSTDTSPRQPRSPEPLTLWQANEILDWLHPAERRDVLEAHRSEVGGDPNADTIDAARWVIGDIGYARWRMYRDEER